MKFPKIEMSKLSSRRSPLRFPLLNMWKEAEATPNSAATTNEIEPYPPESDDFLLHLIYAFAGGFFTIGLLSWWVHRSRREKVCWGDLPEDLLGEIGKRLDSRIDILRFRSACKRWRSSLPAPNRFPLRVPPPPSVDPEYSDASFFITEVENYQVHKANDQVAFQEVVQHAEYQSCDCNYWVPLFTAGKVSFTESRKHPLYRMSLITKGYHIRMPQYLPPNERGFCYFKENQYTRNAVIISSDANGVNPSYARLSDLSVVAHLRCGRLALLRLGASHLSWDTNFCNESFDAIGLYKGKLCTLDISGRIFLMDYTSLQMTQVAVSPLPIAKVFFWKYLFEVRGELCLVDMTCARNGDFQFYKLSMRRKKWIHLYINSYLEDALKAFIF